jgi:hypothetical protein
MMRIIKNLIALSLLTITASSYAAVPYCEGTQASQAINNVLQELVPNFVQSMNCAAGNNCLRQWGVTPTQINYSIAWREKCGPVINGVFQMGDKGLGSTFVCTTNNDKTCCWPLGYKYNPHFVVCDGS